MSINEAEYTLYRNSERSGLTVRICHVEHSLDSHRNMRLTTRAHEFHVRSGLPNLPMREGMLVEQIMQGEMYVFARLGTAEAVCMLDRGNRCNVCESMLKCLKVRLNVSD